MRGAYAHPPFLSQMKMTRMEKNTFCSIIIQKKSLRGVLRFSWIPSWEGDTPLLSPEEEDVPTMARCTPAGGSHRRTAPPQVWKEGRWAPTRHQPRPNHA